ncbi:hypothetical protein ACO0QE_003171 [Hanseniaspora vineae]
MDPWNTVETSSGDYTYGKENAEHKYQLNDDPVMKAIDLQAAGFSTNLDELNGPTSSLFDVEQKLDSINLNEDFYSADPEQELFQFDYSKLQPHQYIVFQDYDIVNILNFLVTLPDKYPHDITIPAVIIYQCSRYIDLELKNSNYLTNFIDLVSQKIQSVVQPPTVNTTFANQSAHSDGKFEKKKHNTSQQSKPKPVDVVKKSYWLGVTNLLYFYFYKEQNAWFYKKNPLVLQKIIDLLKFLVVQVCASIYENITDELVEEVLFSYTSIGELQETLYKSKWNIFNKKSKKKETKEKPHTQNQEERNSTSDKEASVESSQLEPPLKNSSYDEILKYLYPPSLEEQFKSPLKICQIYSALIYCLDLHSVHKLLQQQCLALSVKWFATFVFNKILKNKSKTLCCRAKAMQIRLNLTMIQDWISANNIVLTKPTNSIDVYMWEKFPDTLILDSEIKLRNVLHVQHTNELSQTVLTDEQNALFYYQALTKVSNFYFDKLFELLEWLQVMTTLKDEQSLKSTLLLINNLTITQLLRTVDKYRYEIDEPEFKMKKVLKHLQQDELQNLTVSSSSSEKQLYLPEREFPNGLVLPTMIELLPFYNTSRDFIPLLPLEIRDSIETIHDTNEALHREKSEFTSPSDQEYNAEEKSADEEAEDNDDGNHYTVSSNENTQKEYYPTNMFDNITAPSQAVAKDFVSDTAVIPGIEQNPW